MCDDEFWNDSQVKTSANIFTFDDKEVGLCLINFGTWSATLLGRIGPICLRTSVWIVSLL